MNSTEPKLIRVETVADLPVLWAVLERLQLPTMLSGHFPAPAHWAGELSPGEVLSLWLMFVLSQGDHRLNHVEPWVEEHQLILSALLGKSVLPKHAHDDRLADLLDRLASEDTFAALESQLNEHTIRVYQLPTDVVRIDATTANSHVDVSDPNGLLQFGHSKDDPERPQLKIATAVLDPLGMPLVTSVVPGNSADDPLYVPTIEKVRLSLGCGGRTYIGDCKMAALGTRAFIQAGGDFYLCPLSETQLSRDARNEVLQALWDGTEVLQSVCRPQEGDEPAEVVAEGFSREVQITSEVDGRSLSWKEMRWFVRSRAYAASGQAALEKRLEKATGALQNLATRKQGKKVLNQEQLLEAAQRVLADGAMQGLLSYQVHEHITMQQTRSYNQSPPREEELISYRIEVQRQEEQINQKKRELGWQVYVSNGPELVLSQVIWAYRDQYRVEKGFSRLKGRPLGLTPIYLQREPRMKGLVHLLSVALRLLTLIEWELRERLRESGAKLEQIYAGQKGRKTKRPSAELLLSAMKNIHVSVVEVQGQRYVLLSPMTPLQKQLISLWRLPDDLYTRLVHIIPKSPPKMSEP